MRSTSAVKKRIDSDRWGESRVLTNNSLNPLSRNVSSKLDLIKQQISREFHQKFPSDKKRSNSQIKKGSSFKVKTVDDQQTVSVRRKLNYNISEHLQEPQQRNSQNRTPNSHQIDEYEILKQKFYEMQEKFLCERQKSIDNYQKNSLLKQNIIDFLQQPCQMMANNLKYHFASQKHQNIVNRFIMMNEDIQFAENTLGDLMTIMQVKDIETLLAEIKKKHVQSKSLRQCSERILELQMAYNKLKEDSEAKIEECIKRQEQRENEKEIQIQRKIQIVESSFEQIKKQEMGLVKKMFVNLIKQITKVAENEEEVESKSTGSPELSKLLGFTTFDKNVKKREGYSLDMKDRKVHFGYEVSENLSFEDLANILHSIYKQMNQSFEEIEKEAEQNFKKLLNSNLDLARLEDMIQNVTNQTIEQKQKVIEEYEVALVEKQKYIELSNQKWEKMISQNEKRWEVHVEQLEANNRALQQMDKVQGDLMKSKNQAILLIQKKQFLIQKIIRIICDATGEECFFESQASKGQYSERSRDIQESQITKMEITLKRHLLSLKQNLRSVQNMIIWHEKQLEVKEGILKEFEFNLKKLMQDSQQWEQKEKEVRFERDEYKYLLTNLRENIREIKKEYEQQLIKIASEKDEEYLNSNKDILIHNQQLSKEISKLKAEIKELAETVREETASNAFNKKKSENLEESLREAKKSLAIAESERSKLKQMLNQIEVSFKEVENMSDMNSQKIIVLEQEKQQISSEKIDLQGKKNLLIKQIEIKDDRFHKLQCSYDQIKNSYEKVMKKKEDLERQNSNLRMEQLETVSEMRGKIEEANKIQHENSGLKKENKKLLEQIGSLTKRIMIYVENKSKVHMQTSKASQKVRRQFRALRTWCMGMKKQIRNELQKMQRCRNEQIWQMIKSLTKVMQKGMSGKAIDGGQVLKERVFELKKSVGETKQKFNELNKQICEDLYVTRKWIQNFRESVKGLKVRGGEELSKVVIAKLSVSSCKNEIQQTRQMILKEYKEVQEEFDNFGRVIFKLLKQSLVPSDVVSKQKVQSLQRDHFKHESFKNYPQPFHEQNMEYQSPQFVRIRKSTVSQENESQKFQINEDDGKSERMDKVQQFHSNHPQELEDEQKFGGSWLSNAGEQVKKVKKVLWSLTEKQDPKVDYFDQIKTQYRQLKRKLLKPNFNLDISAVSFRHNTVSSPSSVSFSKDYVFDKRFHTDPNQQIMTIGNKETNRSDYKNDRSVSALRKQNEILREQIEKLEEDVSILQQKQQEYKIQISELAKRNIALENQSSTQMKAKLFLKFLDELLKENWKQAKASCRTFLKLLGLSKEQIDEKMDNFEQLEQRPKKKVNSGFMGGLFHGSSKN